MFQNFYEVFVSKPYYAICVWTWKVIEIKLIDASVDGIAHFINKLGVKARTIQSGNLSSSLKLMVLGLILGLTFCISVISNLRGLDGKYFINADIFPSSSSNSWIFYIKIQ